VDEAQVEELAQRSLALERLQKQDDWQVLIDDYGRKKQAVRASYAKYLDLSSPTGILPIDQRELDYWRGFFAGAEWILDNPKRTANHFKHAFGKLEGSER